jgi:flavin reductase (DIM6/NTAB) family NADH-FMN oxidoreductase RutF
VSEADARSAGSGSLLGLFWTPLVAVGSSDGARLNAQVSVSSFGASIVPTRPRLLSVLYKGNYTHDLVAAKGSFAISVLAADQVALVHSLGYASGRDHDKLAGLAIATTERGNPVFRESLGWLECEVIEAYDLGDATAYLGAVVEQKTLRRAEPLVWSRLRPTLPAAWQAEWEGKIAVDIERSLRTMRWLA